MAVKLNIYLAERGPMNQLSFTKSLQSSFQKMVSDHNRRHALAPDSLALNTAIYNLPASQSPFIQVSDLLSNMIPCIPDRMAIHRECDIVYQWFGK